MSRVARQVVTTFTNLFRFDRVIPYFTRLKFPPLKRFRRLLHTIFIRPRRIRARSISFRVTRLRPRFIECATIYDNGERPLRSLRYRVSNGLPSRRDASIDAEKNCRDFNIAELRFIRVFVFLFFYFLFYRISSSEWPSVARECFDLAKVARVVPRATCNKGPALSAPVSLPPIDRRVAPAVILLRLARDSINP